MAVTASTTSMERPGATSTMTPPASNASVIDRLTKSCEQLALRYPLLPASVSLIAGIVVDRYLPAPIWAYVLAFAAAGGLLVVAWRRQRLQGLLAASAIVLASFTAGGLRHQVAFWRVASNHLLACAHGQLTFIRLRGTVLNEPVCREPDRDEYSLPMRGRQRTSFLLQSEQVEGPAGWATCEGLVRVTIAEALPTLQVGDRIETFVRLRTMNGPGNPGEFDWRLYQRRSGIYLSASADEKESVVVLQQASWATRGLAGLLTAFRCKCRSVLLDDVDPRALEAGLLADYIAGYRWSVSRQVDEAFRLSGTAHILAVSGSHVVLIGAFGAIVGMLVLRRPRRAAMVGLAAVLFFGLFVEPNPPALRAVVMAILAFGAILMHRPINSISWLASSLIVLLLVSPADVFSAGFQLSFLAVAALIAICPTMDRWLFGPRSLAAVIRSRIHLRDTRGLPRSVWPFLHEAISTSVTAWLATAPLLMYHYGNLYTHGALATFVMLPVATVTLALGFCKLVLGLLLPSTNAWTAPLTAVPAGWMASLASWFSKLPGACVPVVPPPVWLIIVFYGLMLLWAWADRRQQRAVAALLAGSEDSPASAAEQIPPQPKIDSRIEAEILRRVRPVPTWLILLTMAAVVGAYSLLTRPAAAPPAARMHVLAVGDGLAVIVRSPGGGVLMYDCGSTSISRVGEAVVVPALRKLGISRIDTVVLSHPNLDHYSGLADLARAIPVGEVWMSDMFLAGQGLAKQLLRDLKQLRVPIRQIAEGQRVAGLEPLNVQCVWPATGFHRPSKSDNDTSVVLLVEYAGRRVLLPGDAGKYAQQQLAGRPAEAIRTDVLVLPHHGRTPTLDMGFVQAVQPQVLIASTADAGRLSQPNLLASLNWRVLDTQTSGMITVDLSAEALGMTVFRQPESIADVNP